MTRRRKPPKRSKASLSTIAQLQKEIVDTKHEIAGLDVVLEPHTVKTQGLIRREAILRKGVEEAAREGMPYPTSPRRFKTRGPIRVTKDEALNIRTRDEDAAIESSLREEALLDGYDFIRNEQSRTTMPAGEYRRQQGIVDSFFAAGHVFPEDDDEPMLLTMPIGQPIWEGRKMSLEHAADVARELAKDPLLAHFMSKRPWSMDFQLKSAKDVLGAKAGLAWAMARASMDEDAYEEWLVNTSDPPYTLSQGAVMAQQSVPVLWKSDMHALALASTVPDHIIDAHLMPFDITLWLFERAPILNEYVLEGILIVQHEHSLNFGEDGVVREATVDQQGSSYILIELGSRRREPGVLQGKPEMRVRYFKSGQLYPDDFAEKDRAGIGALLAMASFMNSPYTETKREPMLDAQVKKLRKQGRKSTENAIHIIRLRAVSRETVEREPSSGVGGKRKYTHKWLVRGHHRKQWYPSRKAHKVIWIAPHMKGPVDAPLKVPVVQVSR